MTKSEVINSYLAAERPYDVCMHSRYGGYLEFAILEKGIMFEDNARMVCDSYADTMRKTPSDNFIGVCVRKGSTIIYEVSLTK